MENIRYCLLFSCAAPWIFRYSIARNDSWVFRVRCAGLYANVFVETKDRVRVCPWVNLSSYVHVRSLGYSGIHGSNCQIGLQIQVSTILWPDKIIATPKDCRNTYLHIGRYVCPSVFLSAGLCLCPPPIWMCACPCSINLVLFILEICIPSWNLAAV